jgi:hypothetical protein
MDDKVPVIKAAGGAVAPNRYIFANDLALLPLGVIRVDLGD